MVDSGFLKFKVDYEQNKDLAVGDAILSDDISAGGHIWRIAFYPRGITGIGKDISLFIKHMTKSTSVKVIFEAFLMDRKGHPSTTVAKRSCVFHLGGDGGAKCGNWGWFCFVNRADLEKDYLEDGHITFVCAIIVLTDSPIPVPPSDIGSHLGSLLDCTDGTDVSFNIDGETFQAHRAVIAARSPVIKAELFGSMAEAAMSSIQLQDIAPATFKVMLRYMYTDALPEDKELMCAQRLYDNVSVETVATTLACAETYNCPELKNKCFDFFAVEENFKEAVFTEGFVLLLQKFSWIAAELKTRVRT